jgi:FemAB-related protein (PEP-CTERM system-associated)
MPTASPAPTRVEPSATRDEWDVFVGAAPDATFFHRAGWMDVLAETFGFRSHFLTARREDRIVGVLPLCELHPPFGKPRLLSLPFAVEAGVSATDDAARRALEDAAVDLAGAIGARDLELRDGLDSDAFQVHADVYCRFRRGLLPDDAANFAAIPRKQRRMIRLGQRSGLCARVDANADVFYDLFARSQHRLGTPLLPRRYFASLLRHFPEDSVVLTVWRHDTPVAGVLSFLFRDRILPYYAGSREEYFRYAINDFMYWELMRLASRRGLATFDFGRSRRGSGAFDYKRHWGFAPEPLRYRIHALGGEARRPRTVDDARLRLLRWGWQHLPLPVTKAVGPLFARHFAPYFT